MYMYALGTKRLFFFSFWNRNNRNNNNDEYKEGILIHIYAFT